MIVAGAMLLLVQTQDGRKSLRRRVGRVEDAGVRRQERTGSGAAAGGGRSGRGRGFGVEDGGQFLEDVAGGGGVAPRLRFAVG